MKTFRYSRPVDRQQLFTIDTLSGVPVGSGRRIAVMTVNTAGEVIHKDSAGVHTVKVEPNVLTVLSVALVPLKGSVYVQLAGIPTSVDSLVASFTESNGTTYRTSVVRSPKVYLSLDGISHGSKGTLVVAGITVAGDTLYKASKECTIDARSGMTIQLTFNGSPGGLSITGTLQLPGATIATGSMGSAPVAETERGDLIITEIMYAANDSEYIEVYNPQEQKLVFDSLIIDIDGTKRLFTDIAVESKQYYVFGRSLLPWVDIAHSVKSALDLSSNGNWITIIAENGSVIDQVVFTGGSNDLEWPQVSGKQSIGLKADSYECAANNFGRNWVAALQGIDGTITQKGTPHLL
jgi:hypothetical protein